MSNLFHTSLLGIAAVLTLNAGQIQLGGSNGLTSSYVNPVYSLTTNPTPASASSCAGSSNAISTSAVGYSGCYVPPTSGTALFKAAYSSTLFSNATPTPTLPASPLSAGGAQFSFVHDPYVTTANGWINNPTSNSTSSNIVIAVGVYGVDKIWTMLNDYWGAAGLVNTTVAFNFSSTSDGSSGVTTESIALTNGQQIRSAVDSNGSTAKTCLVSYTFSGPCASVGSTIATTLAAGPVTIGTATVTAGNVFSSEYTTAPGVNGGVQYAGTTGTLTLDYQLFDFGTLHTNDFLVSVIIKGQLAPTQSGTGGNQTRTALSAITVNQVVPEPGTILLSLAGLGALGYFRRRRKA
ncbi:MAG: hypothetical protein JWN34_4304 [Bryobacterales bacterium]|nr:hypothetical protein [Bryobacterales bacterium]